MGNTVDIVKYIQSGNGAELFKKYDKNKSGKLDEGEGIKFLKDFIKTGFKEWKKNTQNKKINEIADKISLDIEIDDQFLTNLASSYFERFDANNDKVLNVEEFEKFLESNSLIVQTGEEHTIVYNMVVEWTQREVRWIAQGGRPSIGSYCPKQYKPEEMPEGIKETLMDCTPCEEFGCKLNPDYWKSDGQVFYKYEFKGLFGNLGETKKVKASDVKTIGKNLKWTLWHLLAASKVPEKNGEMDLSAYKVLCHMCFEHWDDPENLKDALGQSPFVASQNSMERFSTNDDNDYFPVHMKLYHHWKFSSDVKKLLENLLKEDPCKDSEGSVKYTGDAKALFEFKTLDDKTTEEDLAKYLLDYAATLKYLDTKGFIKFISGNAENFENNMKDAFHHVRFNKYKLHLQKDKNLWKNVVQPCLQGCAANFSVEHK